MHPFSTPWKHHKALRFSDVFREKRKSALGPNGLLKQFLKSDILLFRDVFRTLRKSIFLKKFHYRYLEKQPMEVLKTEVCNFIKKRLWHRCFPVSSANFLRTSFLPNISMRLLLYLTGPQICLALVMNIPTLILSKLKNIYKKTRMR